jgi:hypothetical protein
MPAHWRPSRLNGHLGAAVSALVDGQLDEESTERAWDHVLGCEDCRRQVEREGWLKRQVSSIAARPVEADPPARLVGSLLDLGPVADAWAQVEELEQRGRHRRRTGLVLAGAGSVSAAVLGLTTLGGAGLGLGGTTSPPVSSLGNGSVSTPTRAPTPALVAPAASVHGRLRGWTLGAGDDGAAVARSVDHRR